MNLRSVWLGVRDLAGRAGRLNAGFLESFLNEKRGGGKPR